MTLRYPLPVQFLIGLSDSGLEIIEARPRREPQVILSGTCSYHVHLTPGKFRLRKIWLTGKGNDQSLVKGPAPLVNYIADPDSHSHALIKAANLVQVDGRRCFNPPLLVMHTRRDLVAELAVQCAKKGLGLFLYCPPDVARTEPRKRFDRNRTVVRELLTQYGPVAGIWLDGIGSYYTEPQAYLAASTSSMRS